MQKKEDVPTQRCEENYFACDMVLIPMRVTLFLRRRTSSVIKNDWMSFSHTLFCSWIEAFQATFAENQRDSFYCFVWRAASGGHWLCQSTSILKARVYILYTLWRNSIFCSKIQIFFPSCKIWSMPRLHSSLSK